MPLTKCGKLQCMFISNDSNNTINVNIDNTVLSPSSNIQILGVTIDERLTFNEHINIICSNAARQLNPIKRLQCNLDKESKLAIYRSYILSNFNYCSLVWHFCGIQNSRNMEKIQERALRLVYEEYVSTYDILLKKGNYDMLYIGRLRNMATEIFKALHGSTPIYIRYKGAQIWNDLPNKTKNSITLAEFKNQIKKWQGPRCLCNMWTRLL